MFNQLKENTTKTGKWCTNVMRVPTKRDRNYTKKNSRAKKYNNWVENFTGRAQDQSSTGRRTSELEAAHLKSESEEQKEWRKVNRAKGLMGGKLSSWKKKVLYIYKNGL